MPAASSNGRRLGVRLGGVGLRRLAPLVGTSSVSVSEIATGITIRCRSRTGRGVRPPGVAKMSAASMTSPDPAWHGDDLADTPHGDGVDFLRRALDLTYFLELYAVRAQIGA
jgi:hypothetical protein